jgi:hypothetical protein
MIASTGSLRRLLCDGVDGVLEDFPLPARHGRILGAADDGALRTAKRFRDALVQTVGCASSWIREVIIHEGHSHR